MSVVFLYIYEFIRKRKWFLFLLIAFLSTIIVYGILTIKFREDITVSRSAKGQSLFERVTSNFRFNEKLIVHMYFADDSIPMPADSLFCQADSLETYLTNRCRDLVRSVQARIPDTTMFFFKRCVEEDLPGFLDASDWKVIDTLLTEKNVNRAVSRVYRQLSGPASFALSGQLLGDPLGIEGMALKKLQKLGGNDRFENSDGYLLSRDRRHLLVVITPANPPGETSLNGRLLDSLDNFIRSQSKTNSLIRSEYFGAAAVAVGNAERVKKDVMVTISIALLAILLLVGAYFGSVRVPFLGLLPALFGAGFAIAFLSFTRGAISAIALGIGSVILGLIIDYSLYLINQYRHSKDIAGSLKEMTQSIVVCALTSAGAFLCLVFLESTVLHDLGIFAALSVAGSAFFALIILPHLLPGKLPETRPSGFARLVDRLGEIQFEKKPFLPVLLLILGIASIFFYKDAGFEKDMNSLNFMKPELKAAGERLETLSSGKTRNIYIVAAGSDREHALRVNDMVQPVIDSLVLMGVAEGASGVRSCLFSDSLRRSRYDAWNSQFDGQTKNRVIEWLESASKENGFKPFAFSRFENRLGKGYSISSAGRCDRELQTFFAEWMDEREGLFTITTIIRVAPESAAAVYSAFSDLPSVVAFDRMKLTSEFVERVKRDFDKLVMLSMIFVVLLLWLSFGRIELAILSSVPMFMSWLITLGFMGVSGIRFNIFNIIVSSFIFGLGVDYSILIMRGILADYTYRTSALPVYKVSVIISSATTLLGVAALFLASHPALRSIALISVFGIFILVAITLSIQPLISGWVLGDRLRRNTWPLTARILVKTIITWGNIFIIAMFLTLAGWFIRLFLPLKRQAKEDLFHKLFCQLSRLYIFLVFPYRKLVNQGGEDFAKPAVIISNHQSLIETPALLRLYPRIIILTKTWVHKSPVFGPIARLASFPNVDLGLDFIMEDLRKKVDRGYSILVFPEAHRSADGHIQRFHRGAFYIAEKLQLDILPLMMYGTGEFLQKGAFFGRPGKFIQVIFPRISASDSSYGMTYQERTRSFRRFYIREYGNLYDLEGNGSFFRRKLCLNYIYKGPVLEWYVKVKLRLENNYDIVNRAMPRKGLLLDLGCGYGVTTYMLALNSPERNIIGVDYDEEKIRIAGNGFLNNMNVRFLSADLRSFDIPESDGIILSDVLHYLPHEDQKALLSKCMESVSETGTILIRDADKGSARKHRLSAFTELFSTGSGFNKTSDPGRELYFFSSETLRDEAAKNGFEIEEISEKKLSSNKYFLLRKRTNRPGHEQV
jgi:1-acyl-sn-glycerol-3-phosphate acyltransferase